MANPFSKAKDTYELVKKARQIQKELKETEATSHIPVLMISARYNASNYTLDGIEADDFMAKPFNIDELMEKEDPTNPEFVVDAKLKELWKKKDYGQYANSNGQLNVNFLSNNDITGGNSGSPVINGNGELIGLAFDGNWEAMSGDIYFEPNIQRTISVDIRYVLWLVDKCYGADNLIKEMKLVK